MISGSLELGLPQTIEQSHVEPARNFGSRQTLPTHGHRGANISAQEPRDSRPEGRWEHPPLTVHFNGWGLNELTSSQYEPFSPERDFVGFIPRGGKWELSFLRERFHFARKRDFLGVFFSSFLVILCFWGGVLFFVFVFVVFFVR